MTRFITLISLLVPSLAFALGSDHPAGPINGSQWPAGLNELVNTENRVHGYFVNAQDVFFFKGDAKSLNAFLAKYAELPDVHLEVVIHAGKLEVKSPWDKSPRPLSANWQLYTSPYGWAPPAEQEGIKEGQFLTRVDIWIGDTIALAELSIPAKLSVKSGGEIEAFIKQRDKPSK